MATLLTDIRWSLRLARQRPVFAATLVLTLAGAIAAVTTAAGVARAVLWRPLPFAHAARLAFVWENTGAPGAVEPARVTGYRFARWQRGSRVFSSMALFASVGFLADGSDGATTVRGVRVTTNYFSTLGIAPTLGRDFSAADGEGAGAQVVILSHALWMAWFGGRPDAIGATVRLARRPFTVIGVMPPDVFPAWPVNSGEVTLDAESRQLWVPLPITAALAASSRAHVYGVVARLADGRSLQDAAADLAQLSAGTDPDAHGAVVRPFRDQFVGDARLPLLVLLGAAFAVLLVACTNLAALQGSAIESRRAELTVRAALGAGRARLARQLATEAAIFAVAGTGVGLAIAAIALSRLPRLLPPSVPLLTVPSLDPATTFIAAAAAAFAAATLAAWPLVRMRGVMARGVVPLARTSAFRALVIAQVALAVALAASAALLQQSLDSIRTRHPGFAIDRVLVAGVTLAGTAYNESTDRVVAAERQLTGALTALPGALSVAFAYDHPLEASWIDAYTISGAAGDRSDSAQLRIVSPSYFDTMRVAITEGRAFTERDGLGDAGVALVNQAFADRLLDRPALDRVLRTGSPRASRSDPRIPAEFRIVGVGENERFRGLERPSEPAIYLSTRQFPQQQLMMLMRTDVEPTSLAAAARRAIRGVDAGFPVRPMTTLSEILAEQLVTRRATTHVIDGFAGGALGLAVLGLYGLLALLVGSRTRETGVRLALGSSPAIEAARVVRECLASTVTGVAVGLVLALLGGRLLRSLLVGVSSRDTATLSAVAIAMLTAAVAAAALPAWRAARVDPASALRQ